MNFGDSLVHLKEGKHIARKGWDGKGMYIYLNFGNTTSDNVIETTRYLPCIIMKTVNGDHQPGWLASQSDMLADDWVIV